MPHYDQLIEDILNRDYNLISIWAKAFTLRNMTSITGENVRESVLALLFSPEKILQEEAANLVRRTNKDLFKKVRNRIPVESRIRMEKIMAGELPQAEFLFEKIKFLSTLCEGIPEDEFLFLAVSLKYSDNTDFPAIKDVRNSILWNLKPDLSEVRVFAIDENSLFGITDSVIKSDDSYYYILPLRVVESFRNLYPESSYDLLKYLDEQEKNQ
jgi:hypothetical protein